MKKTLISRGRLLDLSSPKIMAIVNMTPDSFYSGSRVSDRSMDKMGYVQRLIDQGADILDIGGYSTRPGASEVSIDEEIGRILPIIKEIKRVEHWRQVWISVDTFRSEVANAAVEAGADMINDVSGGNLDAKMFETVATLGVPYILMHMRGTPQTMTSLDKYEHLLFDILSDLHQKVKELNKLGVRDICVDPGFGFAKNLEQNYELLHHLDSFYSLDLPLLVGISRKSMIWRFLKIDVGEALNGTSILHSFLMDRNVGLFRVHDTKEMKEVMQLVQKVKSKKYTVK
ncbi:MAG: dihydropteroate synthase [Spirosomataceae bacterium]